MEMPSSRQARSMSRFIAAPIDVANGAIAYLTKQDEEFEGRTLLWDRIEERETDGSTRVIFDLRDHLELEQLCQHQSLPNPNSEEDFFDWSHANALILSEDGAYYYMMLRNLDTLLKVKAHISKAKRLLTSKEDKTSN